MGQIQYYWNSDKFSLTSFADEVALRTGVGASGKNVYFLPLFVLFNHLNYGYAWFYYIISYNIILPTCAMRKYVQIDEESVWI